MAANVILALGSPIKDHTAPSMLGPAITTGTTGAGSLTVVGGLGKTAALAGGSSQVLTGGSSSVSLAAGEYSAAAKLTGGSTVAATHTATQMTGIGLAKTVTLSSMFVSILFAAAAVAAGYLGYRAAKGIWELTSKTIAKA